MNIETYLDENPNCARTFASFRLIGQPPFDPAEVTSRIGIDPDTTTRLRSRGGWLITSEHRLDTTSIERHLRVLLDLLEPHKAAILALIEDADLRADFFCLWRSATGHGGPEISPATLARIAALRASLGFDFYSTE